MLRPLDYLTKQGIISYSVAPLTNGKVLPQSIASLIKPNTRMCVVTTASNVTGETPDLNAIRSVLPDRVLLVADGAQGAGHIPLDMQKTGIDALALAGHKGMGGIQGAGALLFSERMNPRPVLYGGTGSESGSLSMPIFIPTDWRAERFPIPPSVRCTRALCSLPNIERNTNGSCSPLPPHFTLRSVRLGDYTAYFSPNGNGICSFRHNRLPSEEIAGRLSETYDIAVRGGLHCAALVHRALGTYPDGLGSGLPLRPNRA